MFNLCVNCKYHQLIENRYPGQQAMPWHTCIHSAAASMVTGELVGVWCEEMRGATGACGRNGSLFEAIRLTYPDLPASEPPAV